jgi:hypothetical protein
MGTHEGEILNALIEGTRDASYVRVGSKKTVGMKM